MHTKTFALAATLILSLSGPSLAQTAAGGGSTEGNMKNPGSVKSNSEKGMERSTGSVSGGAAAVPGASGGPSNATSGAPAGSNSGNAATGTSAAPSGK